MSLDGFRIIEEGPLETSRLTVTHLVTKPETPSDARVLLLGGSNFDLRLKRSFLKTRLPQHCHLATFEPRGLGASDQPEGDWSMLDYARDAISVLDALGWSKVILLGESFGAMTALHMAGLVPERIESMFLTSCTAGGEGGGSYEISEFLNLSRDEAARRALLLQDNRNEELEINDHARFAVQLAERSRFEKAFFDPSIASGGYARLLAARSGNNCWDRLSEIDIRTTVVAGRFDRQAPLNAQRRMSDRLPNCSFCIFDAGHGLLFGEPGVVDLFMRKHLHPGDEQAAGNSDHTDTDEDNGTFRESDLPINCS